MCVFKKVSILYYFEIQCSNTIYEQKLATFFKMYVLVSVFLPVTFLVLEIYN